jgi:NAD(P)H-dependent flavin oxidoreductase YrpB (nitropropane dioxygenase family)
MRTAFTDLVGVPYPIAGFNRSPGVVAAVTNAGGLGVLAASAYTPEELDAQLTWIEDQVGGKPYGVDLLVPEKFVPGDPDDLIASLRAQIPEQHLAFVRGLLDQYGIPELATLTDNSGIVAGLNPTGAEALLDVAFSHRISLVASALGTPPPSLVARGKAAGVVVAALVGQARHAQRQIEAGVDLLIAQGTEAGGHTGQVASFPLVPQIVDAVGARVPVVAAGGIFDGRGLAAALALGADGVWVGTRFIATPEARGVMGYKEKLLESREDQTTVSRAYSGKTMRVVRNKYTDYYDAHPDELKKFPEQLSVSYSGGAMHLGGDSFSEGVDVDKECYPAGQGVGGISELVPAGDLVRRFVAEAEVALDRMAAVR